MSKVDEYLESIELFYDEKVKFLSQKDNFISCNNCPNEKEFKEKYDEVYLNCGGGGKDCGIKIKIKFPKYLHYERDVKSLNDKLNREINLEEINKFIDVSSKLKEQNIQKKIIEEQISEITEKFYQINVENKKEHIHKFYKSRIEKTKKCKEIQKSLKDPILDGPLKKSLRIEYINLVKQLNQEYREVNEMINTFNPYFQVEAPEVKIDVKGLENKQKKKEEDEKENDIIIGHIVKDIISCNGYKTKKQLLELWGDTVEGDINLKPLYEMVKEKLSSQNKIWRKIEDPPIIRAVLQKHISGYKLFKNNLSKKECTGSNKTTKYLFTKGQEVSWEKDGNIYNGNIVVDTTDKKKIIKVAGIDGNSVFVPKDILRVGFHEPEPQIEEEPEVVEEEPVEEMKYFSGSKDNKWLSTFNVANPFKYNGMEYSSVENAFHAQKVDDNDERVEEYRLALSTIVDEPLKPNEAKKFGGKKSFGENGFTLRPDWDKVKLKIMKEITREYYLSNPEFRDKLINTGNKKLVHSGFRIDDYWGVKKTGGENNHGKILMELREELST